MAADRTTGPVADFCAELAVLQRNSPLSRAALARILNYGRSQLYEILDGRIKRPPEWDRLVEPLVRACLAGNPDSAALERHVAEWRHRHEILVRVWEELNRRDAVAQNSRASASENLDAHAAEWWPALYSHAFVADVSAGTLDSGAFRRWMVDDHYFNVEYQRFVAGLAAIAPNAEATESIASAVSASHLGLHQVRRLAARSFVDVTVEPSLTAVGFAGYLQAQVARGYEPALAALYASEKVYYDLWSSVRSVADRTTPYWSLVEHWSAEPYGIWIARLGELVDSAMPGDPAPDTYRVFDRVIRFELAFLTAIHSGHP
jgi:thiaminase/transcriptional activator TenA